MRIYWLFMVPRLHGKMIVMHFPHTLLDWERRNYDREVGVDGALTHSDKKVFAYLFLKRFSYASSS